MTIQCGKTWLERGHDLRLVVSPTAEVREWATARGIPSVGADADLVAELAGTPVDYLFSVVNLRMLPAEVLALPTRLAVNFHDALLPRDAGTNASTWAVLRGAEEHGVTWHVMTEEADSGDILVQRPVEITKADTSYTLNVKCWQAGAESFAELVDALADGTATRTTQDPALRTYHARTARPDAALTIDWATPAEGISALVRAADFAPHPNGFGTAKIWLGGDFAIVGAAEVTTEESVAPPGTVMSVQPDGLTVATVSVDVRLRDLTTVDGDPLDPAVRAGHRFDTLPADHAAAITAGYRDALRHEPYWRRRLARLSPLDLPHRESLDDPTGWHRLPVTTPEGVDRDTMVAATLAFLGRVCGGGDVGYHDGIGVDEALFEPVRPLRIPAVRGGFAQFRAAVTRRIADLRPTYCRDIVARHPGLGDRLPIVVEVGDAPETGQACTLRAGTVLRVRVRQDGAAEWLVADPVVGTATATALRDSFLAFLANRNDLDSATVLPEDQRRVLRVWNHTRAVYPRHTCAHQLIADQARLRPDALAVVADDATLTYAELDDRVRRLADVLAAAGVAPGDRVAVCLPRHADVVVALLAVLRAGAAYVPLDPIYPRDRVLGVLRDSETRLVITHTALAHLAEGVPTLVIDEPWPDAPASRDLGRSDAPAYVIYTSGSTGRPKGVQVGHRALTNFLMSMMDTPGLGAGDVLLAVTTVCFDIAALELFGPLISGGTVHLVAADTAADADALRDRLDLVRPDIMQATPATWTMLAAAGWTGHPGLKVLCGGEAMRPDLADILLDRADEVWNMYGPTETTIWSSVAKVRRGGPITLGHPIANTVFQVLDALQRPLPIGVPGELCIGGDGVADGYVNRPELTAERFPRIRDARWYRTGDLVRMTPTGDLEYLGRGDHQVKIRGYRIELGEIETTLAAHDSVAQSVVVARDGTLAGYVVAAPGESADPATLVDRLPRTPNGKIDRNALPVPRPVAGAPSRAPETPAERALCAVFAAALDRAEVGAEDSFTDLGGTSVTAATLVARARAAGLPIQAADVFAHRTPAALAKHLASAPSRMDLRAEIGLADDIVPAARLAAGPPRRVLLTGATGFLGAFLFDELAQTGATLHCLVRGTDEAHALARLDASLAAYGLPAAARIEIEVGDLALPGLGLSKDRFDHLADTIDTVFHAGAVVNWQRSYPDLKAANVTGTEQLIRLAARRGVPLHYVSSMGVFAHGQWTGRRHGPADPTGPAEALLTGYQQSKWVTEHNLAIAAGRGLPVTVHRVARVCGDQRTGACQADDFLWRVLKGCVQAQAAPVDTGLLFDLVPADHVAASIVDLARRGATGVHHIANPVLTDFDTLVGDLRAAGYPLLDVDREKWVDLVAADPDNAAYPLLEHFTATVGNPDRVEIPLAPTVLSAPMIDERIVARHVDHFVRTGFLPPA
ncbi:MAG TPA: amino acid adenylation domain-containing protein [Actinokineospora sp.]|nr:amino acid adenylation domain-containing protein [Actinokineospora sp.]